MTLEGEKHRRKKKKLINQADLSGHKISLIRNCEGCRWNTLRRLPPGRFRNGTEWIYEFLISLSVLVYNT